MKIVNLMGNDVWSEADIVNRTEAMIRSQFSDQAVAILNRKATGATLGQYSMTADEQDELAHYARICEEARQAGIQARIDMAFLQAALDVEAAQRRLAQPAFDGPVSLEDGSPNPAAQTDEEERCTAQLIIDGATAETLKLVAARANVNAENV